MPAENKLNPNTKLLFQLGKVCSHLKDVIANTGGLLLTKEPFPDISFNDGVVLGSHSEMSQGVADTTKQWLEGAIKKIVHYVKHELQDNELNGYFNTIDENVLQDSFRTSTKHNASLSLIPTNSNTRASIFLQIILWSCISEKCNHEIIMALNGYDKRNTFKQKESSAKTEYGRLQEMWCYGLSISIKYAVYYSCRLNKVGKFNTLFQKQYNKEQLVLKILELSSTQFFLPALFMENITTKSVYLFGLLGPNAAMLDCFTTDPKHQVFLQSMKMTSNVEQDRDLHMTNVAAGTYVNHARSVLYCSLLSDIAGQILFPEVPTKQRRTTVKCDILSFFIASNKETRVAIQTLANTENEHDFTIHTNLINSIDFEEITTPTVVPAMNDNSTAIHSNLINTGSPAPSHRDGIDFEETHDDGIDFKENSTPTVVPATNDNSTANHSNLINTGSPAPSHHDGIDFEENSTPTVVPTTDDNSNQIKNKLNELMNLFPKLNLEDYADIEKTVNAFVVNVLGKEAANDTEKQIPIRMAMLILCAKDLSEKKESEWPEVIGNFYVDALNKSMKKKGKELLMGVIHSLLDTAFVNNKVFIVNLCSLVRVNENELKFPEKGHEFWKSYPDLLKKPQDKAEDNDDDAVVTPKGTCTSAVNKRKLSEVDRDNSKSRKKLSKSKSSKTNKQHVKSPPKNHFPRIGTRTRQTTPTQPQQDTTPKQKNTTQKSRGRASVAPCTSRSQNSPMTRSEVRKTRTNNY